MRLTRFICAEKTFREAFLEQKNKQGTFQSLTDYLLWTFKERDFRIIPGIKRYLENKRTFGIKMVNKFQDQDYFRLGPDLHAATYTLKLGGRCRLQGSPRWIGEKKDDHEMLPKAKVNNFRVDGLDLSKTVIQENGLSNIENCLNLKTLILANCQYLDDWALVRISHKFSNSLENLDISDCPNISDSGLLILAYLSHLKQLNLSNLSGVKNKEFISLLLEGDLENLVITGSDHLTDGALKNVEMKLTNEELELKKYANMPLKKLQQKSD